MSPPATPLSAEDLADRDHSEADFETIKFRLLYYRRGWSECRALQPIALEIADVLNGRDVGRQQPHGGNAVLRTAGALTSPPVQPGQRAQRQTCR